MHFMNILANQLPISEYISIVLIGVWVNVLASSLPQMAYGDLRSSKGIFIEEFSLYLILLEVLDGKKSFISNKLISGASQPLYHHKIEGLIDWLFTVILDIIRNTLAVIVICNRERRHVIDTMWSL